MVQNPYKLNVSMTASPQTSFVTTVKPPSFTYHLKEAEMTVTYVLPVFMSITEIIKKNRNSYGLGDAVSTLKTFVWILNHV